MEKIERYKTAMDFLDDLYPELAYFLGTRKIEDSFYEAQKVFLRLINRIDDSRATGLFKTLMLIINDLELLPFVDENGKLSILGEEIEAAKTRARKARAEKAIELYQSGKVKVLKFPQTAEAIFKEIVSWWRETKDENEAETLFAFIVTMIPDFFPWKRRENLLAIIKEATDLNFPRSRLLRHILALSSNAEEGAKSDLFRTMLAGWIRSNNSRNIGLALKAAEPLLKEIEKNRAFGLNETVISAFDRLLKQAEKLMELCCVADVLKKSIENSNSGLSFSYAPGHKEKPRTSITIKNSNILEVYLSARPILAHSQSDNTISGEKFFAIGEDFLREWLGKNRSYGIEYLLLKLVIENEFTSFYEKEGLVNL